MAFSLVLERTLGITYTKPHILDAGVKAYIDTVKKMEAETALLEKYCADRKATK